MNQATKAVLLSLLICPGAGHAYLKSYPKAIAFVMIVVAAIGIIVRQAMISIRIVLDEIQAGGGFVDADRIIALATQASQQADTQLVAIATYTIIACWLLASIDAYRLGIKQSTNS